MKLPNRCFLLSLITGLMFMAAIKNSPGKEAKPRELLSGIEQEIIADLDFYLQYDLLSDFEYMLEEDEAFEDGGGSHE